jgi:hypothetical protein
MPSSSGHGIPRGGINAEATVPEPQSKNVDNGQQAKL